MKVLPTLACLIALAVCGPATAAKAPHLALTDLSSLPIVERSPYDGNANADADVAAAFARARKSHKRVLLDMGGNWCGDCVVLANIMLLPEMKPFMTRHFEFVSVDVGRFNKNLQIPTSFGVKIDGGVPAILVVEPDGRTVVNPSNISALEDARHMTPQALADWIAQWAR
jgi:thiol:disulfide interchange protein